jgi:hypothetical protein
MQTTIDLRSDTAAVEVRIAGAAGPVRLNAWSRASMPAPTGRPTDFGDAKPCGALGVQLDDEIVWRKYLPRQGPRSDPAPISVMRFSTSRWLATAASCSVSG